MKKETVQGIIYVTVSIIIMFILLRLLTGSYDISQTTFNPRGYLVFKYMVYTVFGVILGLHNIGKFIKKTGSLSINFYVVAFSFISFILGFGLLFNNQFLNQFLLFNNLVVMTDFIIISFGYSITLILQKV